MFLTLFLRLRDAKVPVSLREYLTLLEALDKGCAGYSPEAFYHLSRAALVKDERYFDKFDRVFAEVLKGEERAADGTAKGEIPEEWLRKLAERLFTQEEMDAIKAMGGIDQLMAELAKRLEEQKGRHQGGSKWVGTGGTSPFGHGGFNPAGVRIGGTEPGTSNAVKAWEKREFANLDDGVEIGTRNYRLALRRLRRFAREGAPTELDLDGTISSTARAGGMLDIKMVPERHNRVKVLLLTDVGGSMAPHVRMVEELFSAARTEFKHLEHYYFHNLPYAKVWKDNRRPDHTTDTWSLIHTFGRDWKLIFVGDASMHPWEITEVGAARYEWNEETGQAWMERLLDAWPAAAWLNPLPEKRWRVNSILKLERLMGGRMFPITLAGLDSAMQSLAA